MEITLKAQDAEVRPNSHGYVEEKITKVEQLAPRTQRMGVELAHRRNPRQISTAECIEITVHGKDPVVCAEASSLGRYAAADIAAGKLYERLHRTRGCIKNHRRYGISPDVDSNVAIPEPQAKSAPVRAPLKPGEVHENQLGDSPVIMREKLHKTAPMNVEEVLDEMELVGHPLCLFIDSETMQPVVIYHRQG